MEKLKGIFYELVRKYTINDYLIDNWWNEIVSRYSEPQRYYHTLKHIEHLISQLYPIKEKIEDWDAVLFSIYFHDFIYNPAASDNEERSAEMADNAMKECNIPEAIVGKCLKHILATKTHDESINLDTKYFLDADLSILGQEWNRYLEYAKEVRYEYRIYPDEIYNNGRIKVLNHFIKMPQIFQTGYFGEKYENQAQQNLKKEIEWLQRMVN